MKKDVEGSFIPVKTYDLVLPAGYKPEDVQQFTSKLPIKKQEKKPQKLEEKNQTSIHTIENEISEEKTSELLTPSIDSSSKKPIPSQSAKPSAAPKKPQLRPQSAAIHKTPSYLKPNPSKTTKELNDEDSQKQGAKNFVNNWLEQAETRRKNSLKQFESNQKISPHFDNKLSDEISELIKKIEHTRKTAYSSIKNMNRAMKTEPLPKDPKPCLASDPFYRKIITGREKPLAKENNVLDLQELYGVKLSSEKSQKPNPIISDDEEFVEDLDFD